MSIHAKHDREVMDQLEEKRSMRGFSDDSPIESLKEDALGHDVFAIALASCILKLEDPNGTVLAVHGPWGSGKSSVINMIKCKIEESNKPITVIPFNSWCYQSKRGIIIGFFHELYIGIKSEKLKGVKKILNYVPIIGTTAAGAAVELCAYVDIITGASANTFFSFIRGIFRRLKGGSYQIRNLQKNLGDSLKKENRRILVVIDEIDRLSPSEAKAIFRIVKSVGKIKNVIYLLAYDRSNTGQWFETEEFIDGDHYLEKIVQASFDLPEAKGPVLINILNSKFSEIFNERMSNFNSRRLYDMVYSAVIPEIKTLRDVYRLANVLSVTFDAVKDYVDLGDFVALEAIRLFRPNVYDKIHSCKFVLTNSPNVITREGESRSNSEQVLEGIVRGESVDVQRRLKKSLMAIFPYINPRFSITKSDTVQLWIERKRACSALHFDTYFRFSASGEAVSDKELQEFCDKADHSDFVKENLLEGLTNPTRYGSKTSLLLDRIAHNPSAISDDKVECFLCTLYSISKNFQDYSDTTWEFGHSTDNGDRIIRISANLLDNRFDDAERSRIMFSSCRDATLDILVRLCVMAFKDSIQDSSNLRLSQNWNLMTEEYTRELRALTLSMVKTSTIDHSILNHTDFMRILFGWYLISENPDEVAEIFKCTFGSDDNVLLIAKAYCSPPYILGDEDEVAEDVYRDFQKVIDMEAFVPRLHDILEKDDFKRQDRRAIMRIVKAASLYGYEKQILEDHSATIQDTWNPFE